MSPKRRHEEDDNSVDDEMDEEKEDREDDEDEDEDDDDDDTIDLDSAEEEEEDDDDDDDDDDDSEESVDEIERRKLFQNESEELMDALTLEDVREVLRENDLDEALAPKLKKILGAVIDEGEVGSMDEAWAEALERLEEE